MVQPGLSVETSAPQYPPVPPSTSQYPPVPPSTSQYLQCPQYLPVDRGILFQRWSVVHGAALRTHSPKVSGSIPGRSDRCSLCSPCGGSLLPVWSYVCSPRVELCVCVYSRRGAVCVLPPRSCVCVLPPRSCVYTPREEVCVCTPAEELCIFPAWLPFFPGPAQAFWGP